MSAKKVDRVVPQANVPSLKGSLQMPSPFSASSSWMSEVGTKIMTVVLGTSFVLSFFAMFAVGQEIQTPELTALPTVLEYEKNWSKYEDCYSFHGATFDLSGRYLLVPVQHESKVSIFDVDTKTEEIVTVDSRMIQAWIDSETGAVFMHMLSRKIEIVSEQQFTALEKDTRYVRRSPGILVARQEVQGASEIPAKRVVCTLPNVMSIPQEISESDTEVHYFPTLDDFRRGTPKWVCRGFSRWLSAIRYIPTRDVFVCSERESVSTDRVILVDGYGREISDFKLPGRMIAVDTDYDSLDLYVGRNIRLRGGKQGAELCSMEIDPDFRKIGRPVRMYPVAGSGFGLGRPAFGTRYFRLRGLKEANISKFFREVYSVPGYWSFEDLQPIRQTLDPQLEPVSVAMLSDMAKRKASVLADHGALGVSLRMASWNQLEAFENPDAYEITGFLGNPLGQILFSRSGKAIVPDLSGYPITDAVINDERQLLAVFAIEHNSRDSKLTVKVLSLEAEGRE